MNTAEQPQPEHRPSKHRRAIPAHCTPHGGTPDVVSKRGWHIELVPHVDRSCVITLDEDGARILFEALAEWLG